MSVNKYNKRIWSHAIIARLLEYFHRRSPPAKSRYFSDWNLRNVGRSCFRYNNNGHTSVDEKRFPKSAHPTDDLILDCGKKHVHALKIRYIHYRHFIMIFPCYFTYSASYNGLHAYKWQNTKFYSTNVLAKISIFRPGIISFRWVFRLIIFFFYIPLTIDYNFTSYKVIFNYSSLQYREINLRLKFFDIINFSLNKLSIHF